MVVLVNLVLDAITVIESGRDVVYFTTNELYFADKDVTSCDKSTLLLGVVLL